jgi:hypothetical protein
MRHNGNNKSSMEKIDKIKCILIDFEIADKPLDEAAKEILLLFSVVKSLPQDNFCQVCNLQTDGEKCYSKRCPV